MFVADDLGAWLIFIIADAGRKKLTSLILGSEQERALQSAATAAVQRTAEEVRPGNAEQAQELALIITEVFRIRAKGEPLASHATVLETLQAGIAARLAVLDDVSLTGTGQSSAQVLGVSGSEVAAKLTGHLLREIVVRGSRGGPLEPLSNQLDHDRSYVQGLRTERKVDRLDDRLVEVLAGKQLDGTPAEKQARTLNERFAAAADRLGSDKPAEVRLGGVYAMARLADDWEENRQTCVDVLCAYLRMSGEPTPGADSLAPERLTFRANREVRHTVIRIIGEHLRAGAAVSWQGLNLDFTGVDFDGGDFSGARFSGREVNFSAARFSGGLVSFEGAEFSGGTVSFAVTEFSGGTVSFRGAKFSGGVVVFSGAQFSGGTVDFSSSGYFGGLAGAEFSGAGVTFLGARFSGSLVSFEGTEFSGGLVSFEGTEFSGGTATFKHAGFSGGEVDFGRAVFSGGEVNFGSARFSGSKVNFGGYFFGAQVTAGWVSFDAAQFSAGEVDFRNVRFSGGQVSFNSANFSGSKVDFRSAKFVGSKVSFGGGTLREMSSARPGTVGYTDPAWSDATFISSGARFSGGEVDFSRAEFTGGVVNFSGDYTNDFFGARFSGGLVSFERADFSGGEVDFSKSRDWSHPPIFGFSGGPPPGIKLPDDSVP